MPPAVARPVRAGVQRDLVRVAIGSPNAGRPVDLVARRGDTAGTASPSRARCAARNCTSPARRWSELDRARRAEGASSPRAAPTGTANAAGGSCGCFRFLAVVHDGALLVMELGRWLFRRARSSSRAARSRTGSRTWLSRTALGTRAGTRPSSGRRRAPAACASRRCSGRKRGARRKKSVALRVLRTRRDLGKRHPLTQPLAVHAPVQPELAARVRDGLAVQVVLDVLRHLEDGQVRLAHRDHLHVHLPPTFGVERVLRRSLALRGIHYPRPRATAFVRLSRAYGATPRARARRDRRTRARARGGGREGAPTAWATVRRGTKKPTREARARATRRSAKYRARATPAAGDAAARAARGRHRARKTRECARERMRRARSIAR